MSNRPLEFTAWQARAIVPLPAADANKYSRGYLAVVAGCDSYPGAAVLAARAAERAGAGYTRLLTPEGAAECARCHLVSVPVTAVPEKEGGFCQQSLELVLQTSKKAAAILCGPGLGRARGTFQFVRELAKTFEAPMILDADALNAFEGQAADLAKLRDGKPTVITPHEGEAARLLGRKVKDRVEDACELASLTGAVAILKGPQTLVANPQGKVLACTNAGPELAKAGSGDVLAGMTGAFLAQAMSPIDAAALAVYLHGAAGNLAAKTRTSVSAVPQDIVENIGLAIHELGV